MHKIRNLFGVIALTLGLAVIVPQSAQAAPLHTYRACDEVGGSSFSASNGWLCVYTDIRAQDDGVGTIVSRVRIVAYVIECSASQGPDCAPKNACPTESNAVFSNPVAHTKLPDEVSVQAYSVGTDTYEFKWSKPADTPQTTIRYDQCNIAWENLSVHANTNQTDVLWKFTAHIAQANDVTHSIGVAFDTTGSLNDWYCLNSTDTCDRY